VHDWLCDDSREWILILDNVDDAGFLVKAQCTSHEGQTNSRGNRNSHPLVAYLPQCLNGSILITTRSKSAAVKLVEQRDIIAVEPMGKADALALFKNKLGWHDDGGDTAELAAALEFMPLAIVQAAAYICQERRAIPCESTFRTFRRATARERVSLTTEANSSVETGRRRTLSLSHGKYHSITSRRSDHQLLVCCH
jgi:hypothetical protein